MSIVFPTVTFEIALAQSPDADPPIWEDFSAYLTGFSPERGRPDERAVVDAGAATVRLRNDERIFDPTWGCLDTENLILSAESFESVGDLTSWDIGSGYSEGVLLYPSGTSTVPKEGNGFGRILWLSGSGTSLMTRATSVPAAGRYCFALFVMIPQASDWNGGNVRVDLTNFTGATFVARGDASTSNRDVWQRAWVIYDVAAGDLTGTLNITAVSAPSGSGDFVNIDFAEFGELQHGQTALSTGPLYPNLTPERPIRVRAGFPNVCPNPSFETNTTGWSATGGATLSRIGSLVEPDTRVGTAVAQATMTGSADSGLLLDTGSCPAASPGEIWSAATWLRGIAGRTVTLRLRALNASNSVLATYTSNTVTLHGLEWRRAFVTSPALPASTAKVQIVVASAGSGTAGNMFSDGYTLGESGFPIPTLEATDGIATQYVGRIDTISLDFPAHGHDSYAEIEATDLIAVLEEKKLPTTSPTFETYPELVEFDKPFWYGRHGEKIPNRLFSVVGGDKSDRYVNPVDSFFGGVGAIQGDYDSAVRGSVASQLRTNVHCENTNFSGSNRVTVEAWVNRVAGGTDPPYALFNGPEHTGVSVPIFELTIEGSPTEHFVFRCRFEAGGSAAATSTTAVVADEWFHVVGVWDGTLVYIYVNGVEEDSTDPSGTQTLRIPNESNPVLRLFGFPNGGVFSNAWLDEPAAYERRLPAARILAHYQGGLRGFQESIIDDRVNAILDLFGTLVPAASRVFVDVDSDEVASRRQYGQSALSELRACERAADGLIFADRSGRFVILGNDYRTTGQYAKPRLSLSNEPAVPTTYPYGDLSVAPIDNAYVINRSRLTPEKPHDPVSNPEKTEQQMAWSDPSIRRYGERLDPAEELIPVTSDARALAIATNHVIRNRNPCQRLTGVKLAGGYDDDGEIWRAILERDLEDMVAIEKHDPNGLGKIAQRSRIKKIVHQVGVGAGETSSTWTTEWTLAPAHV